VVKISAPQALLALTATELNFKLHVQVCSVDGIFKYSTWRILQDRLYYGLADGEYTDMTEGQGFRNKKCYEKALKLSRLHNREIVE